MLTDQCVQFQLNFTVTRRCCSGSLKTHDHHAGTDSQVGQPVNHDECTGCSVSAIEIHNNGLIQSHLYHRDIIQLQTVHMGVFLRVDIDPVINLFDTAADHFTGEFEQVFGMSPAGFFVH